MHTLVSPLALFAICTVIVVFAGIATLRWSHRHRLLKFLAICAGLALLWMSNSRDRTVAESTAADLTNYQAQVQAAEATENQQAARIAKLEEANKDVETLLKQSSAEKQEAAEEAKRLRETLMEAAKTVADVVPDKSNKTVTLRIKEAVLFDVDKSALECNSKETLSKVIGFLTYQVRVPHTEIQILGHTDITGTDAHDDALSDARAAAVKRYFTSAGIPEDIITAKGMGKRQPTGTTEPQLPEIIRNLNRLPEQRTKNRRVEIVVSTQ